MDSKYSISDTVSASDRMQMNYLFKRNVASLHYVQEEEVFYSEEDDSIAECYLLNIKDDRGIVVAGAVASAPEADIYARANRKANLIAKYSTPATKIRELKLIAVDEDHRQGKLASHLLHVLEKYYYDKGFRVLYGTLDDAGDQEGLATFYRRAGYSVVSKHNFPNFFGQEWCLQEIYNFAGTRVPSTFFFKILQ